MRRLGRDPPLDVVVAGGFAGGAGELVEGSAREIKVVASAARAHVLNLSLDLVAVHLDSDGLAAPGIGRVASGNIIGRCAIGRLCKSNNHHVVSQ